jgi:copper(I)-binding protein
MKKNLLVLVLIALFLTACSAGADTEKNGMIISQAHIYLPAATSDGSSESPVAAAFMTIDNNSGLDDHLIGARSDFAMTQVHEMVMDGGVMKMQEVASIDIPNDSGIVLKSGGYHVMLMGLTGNIKVGEEHTITLIFEKSGSIDVSMLVTAEE